MNGRPTPFYRSGEGGIDGISLKKMTACPRSGAPLVCPETYERENEPLKLQLILHSPPELKLK
jgi:hypothetical protein